MNDLTEESLTDTLIDLQSNEYQLKTYGTSEIHFESTGSRFLDDRIAEKAARDMKKRSKELFKDMNETSLKSTLRSGHPIKHGKNKLLKR